MNPPGGTFVVLEGLDGAGTTTQARLLDDALESRGLLCHLTREPTDSAVGTLIREALSRPGVSSGAHQPLEPTEEVLCLLFAADRLHHRVSIERHRNGGATVICDRYVHSSIAYQTLDPTISAERVVDVNSGIATPDVTFFLRVPVDQCLNRLGGRNDTRTIYEKKDLLVAIEKNYDDSRPLYEKHFGPVIEIDGTPAPEAVHAGIMSKLEEFL